MSDGDSQRDLQKEGVCKTDRVLGRLVSCRKSWTRFLRGSKVRRTCFIERESLITDLESSSWEFDCREDIGHQKSIDC